MTGLWGYQTLATQHSSTVLLNGSSDTTKVLPSTGSKASVPPILWSDIYPPKTHIEVKSFLSVSDNLP